MLYPIWHWSIAKMARFDIGLLQNLSAICVLRHWSASALVGFDIVWLRLGSALALVCFGIGLLRGTYWKNLVKIN